MAISLLLLVVGFGCWLLVVGFGCWLLVVGCWLVGWLVGWLVVVVVVCLMLLMLPYKITNIFGWLCTVGADSFMAGVKFKNMLNISLNWRLFQVAVWTQHGDRKNRDSWGFQRVDAWKKKQRVWRVPSGKHIKNYGKSPFLIGQSAINGVFSITM